ncbi:unnamed protein product [Arabis nemorensis]|uniref:RRM domain-containing protein n=1 Tax=Arabis nemorensis TaxID=586526 RepID=A0A565BFY5_9BRAS|nr:unnamed protein product [Arabis nemorensis]
MGKELRKGLKRCSTSTTDAEASDHKDKKPLQIAESELQTDVKKQKKSESKQIDEDDLQSKKISEIEELKKVRKSLVEALKKKLQEEELPKKTGEFECCFDTKDADGMYCNYIFVRGFDTALPRDVIRAALWKRFESLGCDVRRVFVPIECRTGVPLGIAFVCVVEEQKALALGGGYMGDYPLFVMKDKNQSVFSNFPNFKGCDRCWIFLAEHQHKRFIARRGKYRIPC